MIKKIDFTYEDTTDDILGKYLDQKERLNNANIESFNDYITDDVIGEDGFKNEIVEFFNILAICLAMVELKLYDKYFFDELQEMIAKYKDGYFNDYLADNENIAQLDTNVAKIEQYIKLK